MVSEKRNDLVDGVVREDETDTLDWSDFVDCTMVKGSDPLELWLLGTSRYW